MSETITLSKKSFILSTIVLTLLIVGGFSSLVFLAKGASANVVSQQATSTSCNQGSAPTTACNGNNAGQKQCITSAGGSCLYTCSGAGNWVAVPCDSCENNRCIRVVR